MDKDKIDLISIKLTNACNLKCNMCWQSKNNRSNYNIDYSDFLIILKKIQFLSPNKIYLWGGEPLLHPEIIKIIRAVKRHKFTCHLITNGTLLEKYTEELINAKLDTINISLDGTENIHDNIRGAQGTYHRVINGLNKLINKKKFRPIISINTVINKFNYTELYEIIKQFYKFKVNGLQIQLPVFFSEKDGLKTAVYLKKLLGIDTNDWRGFIDEYNDINIDKLNSIVTKIRKKFPDAAFYPSAKIAKTWFKKNSMNTALNCCMPWKRINIEPNGNMNICTDYADMIAGNLLEKSFDEIWNNEIYKKFREQLQAGYYMPICKHCTYSHLPWRK